MNIVAPLPARLVVEVVFDFVCPWCYLGIKRLSFLLERRQDLAVELLWRPFLLNPDMPRSGMSRTDYMIRKFGAEDRARRLYASIAELGAAEGITFNFPASAARPAAWTPTGSSAMPAPLAPLIPWCSAFSTRISLMARTSATS